MRPAKLKKSPAPLFHAASKASRQGPRAADGLFLVAFREAAERLKAGDRLARFPNGCFPPALPFVGLCVPVLVLEVLKKKTQSTPREVAKVCRRRLADYDQIG